MHVQLGAINKPTGYNATDSGLEDVNKLLKYSSQASCPASPMDTCTIISVMAKSLFVVVVVALHVNKVQCFRAESIHNMLLLVEG